MRAYTLLNRSVSFAAVATLLLFASAASEFASAHRAATGPWKHDSIEGVEEHHYTEEKKLYRVHDASNNSNSGGGGYRYYFDDELPSDLPADERSLAVRLRTKPNASNWQYVSYEGLLDGVVDTAEAYYAVGFAEGYTTMDGIWSTWVNQVESSYKAMLGLAGAPEFIDEHLFYTWTFPTDTAFGGQLRLLRHLLDGLTDGWHKKYDEKKHDPKDIRYQLNRTHMYLLSYMEELLNVNGKFQEEERRRRHDKNNTSLHSDFTHILSEATFNVATSARGSLSKESHARQHCSAMVRRTENDVFLAHDTWGMYDTMLRQFKTYKVGDHFVAMSGYPGSISSIDDFYMTSHKLAVTETTNGFFKNSLYDAILPTQISTFNRAMIANFVAETPKQWFDLFAYNNSGTYNNQWMVLETQEAKKAVDEKRPMQNGTFFVGEQMPGLVVFEDQTTALDARGFWPSYNIPFYKAVYDGCGFNEQNTADSAGFWSYTNYSRAQIFAAKGLDVTDEASMWYLLRYNDWETDPASLIPWCKENGGHYDCAHKHLRSAALSIAARFDQAPKVADNIGPDALAYQVNRGLFGAIDTKMTSAKMLLDRNFEAVVINGPTAVQQPFFNLNEFLTANPQYELSPWRGVAVKFDAGAARIHPLEDRL